MPTIFSSPLLKNQPKNLQNAEYALSYYLERAIPRGSVIYALFPKTILGRLLPQIAKMKNCTVISFYGTHEATLSLLKAGKYDKSLPEPDIILTEPDGFAFGGALFKPEETKIVNGLPLICIGSSHQWTPIIPATHDLVHVQKIISEHGIHTPEQIEEIISSSYSSPSIPSQASRYQTSTP